MTARVAAGFFVLLAILHLWPLSSAPWRLSLNYNGDAEYNAWAIAWIVRTLPTNPAALFDANIFSPEPGTLAYSHPIVAPAILVAPVVLFGGSPVLAFNLSIFAGLVLTAWALWFVARDWTGSPTAALVAGALGAFNVHLLTHLPHVTAAHAWGLPLTLYLADRMMEQPTRRAGLLLAAVVALTAATSLYWLALAAVVLCATAIVRGLPWRRTVQTAGASVLGVALASPLLWPYVRLATDGVRRPIEMVGDFSAELTGYLSSSSVVHAGWSARFYRDDLNLLFAGFTAIGLAGLGVTVARGTTLGRRRMATLALMAAAGVLLSLGPFTPIYRALYEILVPLQALRAVAQFGFLYLTAIAVAAAYGVARLERRAGSGKLAGTVTALALAAVTIEVWQGPVRTEPFSGVPPIYTLLADLKGTVRLAEVPFWPPDGVHFNGEYVLGSTAHWRPLMNGTSGLTPASYRERAKAFWFFPRDWAIQAMVDEGVTHVMVHLEQFEHEAPMVMDALIDQQTLQLIASDSHGHRLYEVRTDAQRP